MDLAKWKQKKDILSIEDSARKTYLLEEHNFEDLVKIKVGSKP